ncbi:hypothetical protein Hanom_Chr10g00889511 [Helianthus anomalus]
MEVLVGKFDDGPLHHRVGPPLRFVCTTAPYPLKQQLGSRILFASQLSWILDKI